MPPRSKTAGRRHRKTQKKNRKTQKKSVRRHRGGRGGVSTVHVYIYSGGQPSDDTIVDLSGLSSDASRMLEDAVQELYGALDVTANVQDESVELTHDAGEFPQAWLAAHVGKAHKLDVVTGFGEEDDAGRSAPNMLFKNPTYAVAELN